MSEDYREIKGSLTDRTMALAYNMVKPYVQDFESLTDDEKHRRISDLMIAMGYSISVLAHKFLDTTPETFGEHMGKFLKDTLQLLKKFGPAMEKEAKIKHQKGGIYGTGASANTEESVWD